MSVIKTIFTPNYVRYEGVRPINIYLLRMLYFLMLFFVGSDAWMSIINHQGSWESRQSRCLLRLGRIFHLVCLRADSSAKNAADHTLYDLL